MIKTLKYYEENAKEFIASTLSVDMHEIQDEFLSFLTPGDLILDYGCGSGRDSKYFLEKGFKVESFDGCKTFCDIASKLTGIVVKNITFSNFSEEQNYDGIWACSSLLHAQKKELPYLLKRIEAALKKNGIFYCSFKKGDFEGGRNGRYFSDFTKEELANLIKNSTNLSEVKTWQTSDARPDRKDEWLNSIWIKG
jgi:SAM-dependent methyltransferase